MATTYEKTPLKTMTDALEFQLERNHARLAAAAADLFLHVDRLTRRPANRLESRR